MSKSDNMSARGGSASGEKNKLTFFLAAIALIILVGVGLTLVKSGGIEKAGIKKEDTLLKNEVKEFTIDAFRFGYNPNTVTIKKGGRVRLNINNTDTKHGIRIPDLGISGNESLEFVADKSGEFNWYCNNYCGDGHQTMAGKLIVE